MVILALKIVFSRYSCRWVFVYECVGDCLMEHLPVLLWWEGRFLACGILAPRPWIEPGPQGVTLYICSVLLIDCIEREKSGPNMWMFWLFLPRTLRCSFVSTDLWAFVLCVCSLVDRHWWRGMSSPPLPWADEGREDCPAVMRSWSWAPALGVGPMLWPFVLHLWSQAILHTVLDVLWSSRSVVSHLSFLWACVSSGCSKSRGPVSPESC